MQVCQVFYTFVMGKKRLKMPKCEHSCIGVVAVTRVRIHVVQTVVVTKQELVK